MKITQQEVEAVAKLARLDITAAEKEMFAKQLSQILTHVEQLNRYDTAGVEPTSTVLGQVNVFRDDVVRGLWPGRNRFENLSWEGFNVRRPLWRNRNKLVSRPLDSIDQH